ncbi:MAG: hypothetical protein WAV20_19690 [Blastocatellia bacterium]
MRLSSYHAGRITGRLRAGIVSMLTVIILVILSFQSLPAEGAPSLTNFEGFHDGANCSQIFGWAWDSNQPNTPINVDIYSDNVLVATALADQFRQDLLNAGKGNGAHGFSIATPAVVQDGQPHSIRVRISNTSVDLGFTPKTVNCAKEGFQDIADCNVIAGWAWDPNQPNTPINVDVYFDNDNFSSIIAPADKFRQDLLDAGKGNGFHGYSFPTPAVLKDGHTHTIRVKFSGTNVDLGNTPKMVNCPSDLPAAYEGFHDEANCSVISGWVWDSNHPNVTLSVDIYDQNVIIATIPADQFRQDLLDNGKGNGFHAFSFTTPMSVKDGNPHLISVGVHDTDVGLGNTPKTVNCSVAAFEGFHDAANCPEISGWAWDANQPNTPISVDIYSDNVLVTTVSANQFRQDLLNAGKGNGSHGFTFVTPASLKNGQPHSIRVKFAGTNTDLGNTPKGITCP